MEIDIAPQFGAELKVSTCPLSCHTTKTDPVRLRRMASSPSTLGYVPTSRRIHIWSPRRLFKIPSALLRPSTSADEALPRFPTALLGSMTYNSSTGSEA
jgi:hypothetical protein